MANKKTEAFIKSLQRVVSGKAWYGKPVQEILDSVEPQKAFKTPAPGSHSIAALLSHMLYWREFVIARLNGNVNFEVNQNQSFDWQSLTSEAENGWAHLLTRFNDSQTRLISVLRTKDDDFLDEKVAGRAYTFHVLLEGILQHDVYHAGQIAYLAKLMA